MDSLQFKKASKKLEMAIAKFLAKQNEYFAEQNRIMEQMHAFHGYGGDSQNLLDLEQADKSVETQESKSEGSMDSMEADADSDLETQSVDSTGTIDLVQPLESPDLMYLLDELDDAVEAYRKAKCERKRTSSPLYIVKGLLTSSDSEGTTSDCDILQESQQSMQSTVTTHVESIAPGLEQLMISTGVNKGSKLETQSLDYTKTLSLAPTQSSDSKNSTEAINLTGANENVKMTRQSNDKLPSKSIQTELESTLPELEQPTVSPRAGKVTSIVKNGGLTFDPCGANAFSQNNAKVLQSKLTQPDLGSASPQSQKSPVVNKTITNYKGCKPTLEQNNVKLLPSKLTIDIEIASPELTQPINACKAIKTTIIKKGELTFIPSYKFESKTIEQRNFPWELIRSSEIMESASPELALTGTTKKTIIIKNSNHKHNEQTSIKPLQSELTPAIIKKTTIIEESQEITPDRKHVMKSTGAIKKKPHIPHKKIPLDTTRKSKMLDSIKSTGTIKKTPQTCNKKIQPDNTFDFKILENLVVNLELKQNEESSEATKKSRRKQNKSRQLFSEGEFEDSCKSTINESRTSSTKTTDHLTDEEETSPKIISADEFVELLNYAEFKHQFSLSADQSVIEAHLANQNKNGKQIKMLNPRLNKNKKHIATEDLCEQNKLENEIKKQIKEKKLNRQKKNDASSTIIESKTKTIINTNAQNKHPDMSKKQVKADRSINTTEELLECLQMNLPEGAEIIGYDSSVLSKVVDNLKQIKVPTHKLKSEAEALSEDESEGIIEFNLLSLEDLEKIFLSEMKEAELRPKIKSAERKGGLTKIRTPKRNKNADVLSKSPAVKSPKIKAKSFSVLDDSARQMHDLTGKKSKSAEKKDDALKIKQSNSKQRKRTIECAQQEVNALISELNIQPHAFAQQKESVSQIKNEEATVEVKTADEKMINLDTTKSDLVQQKENASQNIEIGKEISTNDTMEMVASTPLNLDKLLAELNMDPSVSSKFVLVQQNENSLLDIEMRDFNKFQPAELNIRPSAFPMDLIQQKETASANIEMVEPKMELDKSEQVCNSDALEMGASALTLNETVQKKEEGSNNQNEKITVTTLVKDMKERCKKAGVEGDLDGLFYKAEHVDIIDELFKTYCSNDD